MQQKLMMYMTIGFGLLFWHVPAGLCVYFIASSFWGLTERKLLDRMTKNEKETAPESVTKAAPVSGAAGDRKERNGKKDGAGRKMPGFLARLAEAAAAANESATQTRESQKTGTAGKGKKKRKPRR